MKRLVGHSPGIWAVEGRRKWKIKLLKLWGFKEKEKEVPRSENRGLKKYTLYVDLNCGVSNSSHTKYGFRVDHISKGALYK